MTTIEKIARELEPQAWAALGTGDTLAYKNRRTSSLRKAIAAVKAIREPSEDQLNAASNLAWKTIHADENYPTMRACIRGYIDSILTEATGAKSAQTREGN